MALQLSRREVEDLRSSLDRAIYRTIGKSDSALLSTVSSCLTNGYERRKIIDRLSSHIDSKKASKLADKAIALAQEHVASSKSQKRKHESSEKDKDTKRSRHDDRHESREERRDRHDREKDKEDKEKKTDNGLELPEVPEGETIGSKMAGLSADKIKLMMANAQKEIEERKRALISLKSGGQKSSNSTGVAAPLKQQSSVIPPPSVIKPMLYTRPGLGQNMTAEEMEKQKKIAELQARIERKLAGGALAAASALGPAPLILDRDGRTVDTSGKRVQLTHVAPTLKANIRAKRREEFRAQLSGAAAGGAEAEGGAWVDPRVPARPAARARRALRFHEPGKFRQLAERLRMKAQLEKLQNEISQIARKTGISSATKLALLAADAPDADRVPDIEWWDSVILLSAEEREARGAGGARAAACNTGEADIVDNVNEDAITNLVEHPQQLRAPSHGAAEADVHAGVSHEAGAQEAAAAVAARGLEGGTGEGAPRPRGAARTQAQDIEPYARAGHGGGAGPHRHRGQGPRADRQATENSPGGQPGARAYQRPEKGEDRPQNPRGHHDGRARRRLQDPRPVRVRVGEVQGGGERAAAAHDGRGAAAARLLRGGGRGRAAAARALQAAHAAAHQVGGRQREGRARPGRAQLLPPRVGGPRAASRLRRDQVQGDADGEAGPRAVPEAPRGALLGPRLQRGRARRPRRGVGPVPRSRLSRGASPGHRLQRGLAGASPAAGPCSPRPTRRRAPAVGPRIGRARRSACVSLVTCR